MRAVVLNGPRQVSVEHVDDPVLPGPDGAIVRVARTAICGSDLHLYEGRLGTPGVHLGHEFIGTVAEIGADVRTVKPGDRVLASGVIGCGRCVGCRAGDPVACEQGGPRVFGTDPALPGGQAEAVAVPAADHVLHRIPETVTDEQAVLLTDILPTGYIGARRADVSPGDTVAVIGLGPVGTLALVCAQLLGAARVIGVDPLPDRRAHAERLGAITIDPAQGGTAPQVIELTGGRGADAVIEAVGSDATVTDAIFSARATGTVSVVGVNLNLAFPFPLGLAMGRNLTFRAAIAPIPSTWPALLPLVASGRLHPEEVFTHRLPLSEAARAYHLFANREDGCLKVLLDPVG
jgi:2-desacetyl-2-hydroxyethyl bacteriochlorophyllide A dehydrogenase